MRALEEVADVVIIGAGFCGLATGAALRACGVENFIILEQGSDVGNFWSRTYDRLHLHSAWHDLPHDAGLNARYAMYKPRDEVVSVLFRFFRAVGLASPAQFDKAHRLTVGTPEFDNAFPRRFSVDLSRYGIRRPVEGPLTETSRYGRIPVLDQGAIRRIRSGAIRIIDGNVRPIEGFTRDGVRCAGGAEKYDAVIVAAGFAPQLESFLDDHAALLGPVRWHRLAPLTDGRSRSRVYPSAFFPGFDPSVNGGLSLGRWGWEAGEKIASEGR